LNQNKKINTIVKFSGLGIQMALFVVILTLAGRWIDQFFTFKFPIFTIVGVFIGLIGAMYYMIKQLK
jgi:hypothetical protein